MNQNTQYPKSEGGLWLNQQKANEKHPDYRGGVDITREQMQILMDMGRAGIQPRLQLAAWSRVAQGSGQPYIYISGEAYFKQETAQPDMSQQPTPYAQQPPPPMQPPMQPPPQAYQQQPQPVQPQPMPTQQQQPVQQPAPQQPVPETVYRQAVDPNAPVQGDGFEDMDIPF